MFKKNKPSISLAKSHQRIYKKCVSKADKIVNNKKKIAKLIRKARNIFSKLHNLPKCDALARNICSFCDLLSDYFDGIYKNLPLSTIVALLAGIIYLVSPFDAIVDYFPAIGWIDDAAVLGFVIAAEQNDIREYLQWKENHSIVDAEE